MAQHECARPGEVVGATQLDSLFELRELGFRHCAQSVDVGLLFRVVTGQRPQLTDLGREVRPRAIERFQVGGGA
ncbi:MAG TPA: hypothetical protein VFS23_31225 [Vicinamibacterales bacterium]|nr:hypothetical protein [Vicinamibacterales bacterium]